VGESATYPDDDNGAVLRRLEEGGDDLTRPRNINFEHVFVSKEAAFRFAAEVVSETDEVRISWYEAKRAWDVQVTRHMVPTHRSITELEEALGKKAKLHGGYSDGWGCFGVEAKNDS
jgi:hypothetical protein